MTPPLAITPQPTSNNVGAGTWLSGTGNTQTSSVSSGNYAPVEWAEYRQWLVIDYARVPSYNRNVSNTVFRSLGNLSASNDNNVTSTRLHVNVRAHTSCTFVNGNYAASSFYQPQKFELVALSTDTQGNPGNYGDLTGSANSYVFGAQGQIYTTQPYIRRHIKGASDVEYTITTEGTTDYNYIASGVTGSHSYVYQPGNNIHQDFRNYTNQRYRSDCEPYDATYPQSDTRGNPGDFFSIAGGGYSVSSEPGHNDNANGLNKMINFIESYCANFNNSYYRDRLIVGTPVLSDGGFRPDSDDHVEVNPYYDAGHHDYS